jgi:thioredoxin 1
MKTGMKVAIVVLLAVAVAATFALRGGKRAEYRASPEPPPAIAPSAQGAATRTPAPATQGAATQMPAPAPVAVAAAEPAMPAALPAPRAVAAAAKPRLLELGSMRCQACLEMAKVLDALRASQGEKLQVDFIDVFEQPEAADRHKITLIPTQILFDSSGREIFRHTGYFAHNEILAKFRELGVKF